MRRLPGILLLTGAALVMLIQGVVFDYESDDQGYRQKFARAWIMVNKEDSGTLGHKILFPLNLILGGCKLVLRNS